MMFTKALDLLTETEKKVKEVENAQFKLRMALAAIAEIEKGAQASLRLLVPDASGQGFAQMDIDGVLESDLLTGYVKERLEKTAKLSYMTLLNFNGEESKTVAAEAKPDAVTIPDRLKKDPEPPKVLTLETPETVPEDQPGKIIENGRKVANVALIEKLYFKDGKSARQIAAELELAESCVFNHLKKLKAEKEQAAKECVRR